MEILDSNILLVHPMLCELYGRIELESYLEVCFNTPKHCKYILTLGETSIKETLTSLQLQLGYEYSPGLIKPYYSSPQE